MPTSFIDVTMPLGNTKNAADLRHLLALSKQDLGLTKLADDLFG